ncbi:MAG TPA: hypothetical protein VHO06_01570 [Polyangia bacterium]|nr:hypothetical protein [Polyangia bacterium]
MRRAWVLLRFALCLAGAQLLSCDETPPIDEHFDSSLGEDFKPPPGDAGTPADAADGDVAAPQ